MARNILDCRDCGGGFGGAEVDRAQGVVMVQERAGLFVCQECGYGYREREWAEKCEAWCHDHNSCNLEIIEHGLLPWDEGV